MPVVDASLLAAWTLELCGIPSVTGDEDAVCGITAALVAKVAPGVVVTRVGNSLVCRPPAVLGRPTVGLFGHLDTVKPATDQPLEVSGGRVFGCGASDMKGGLAVMLAILARHAELTAANVVAVFYDKEEGPAVDNGLEPLYATGAVPDLDFAFCLEPTDNRVQVGCVGGLHAEVVFRGRRAHSARPWQGENAIYKATAYLARLRDRGRIAVPFGDLTYYEVMNATMASTVNSRNVLPDAFTLNVNYRFAPGKAVEAAKQELLDLVDGEADVTFIDEAPAGAVCIDHPFLTRLGLPLEPKQAWTDVARLTARGIPAVNFGPGETAQAHQARESIAIADLDFNYRAFAAFFGGQPGANLA
ncbi:MAG: peptidase [Cyanobacteria bacterium RYN_339]|nr:peptidase [Cyanobacteria bacterium RYN_339]